MREISYSVSITGEVEPAPLLRPFWGRIFRPAWILSLILFVILACVRALGLFGPVSARMWTMVGFFSMWFLPALFFSKGGRTTLGIKKIERPLWLVWGALLGAAAALFAFALGYLLYGHGPQNWYVSIMRSLAIDSRAMQLPGAALLAMYTLPAVIFSPIGEELFFRGIIHETVRERWGMSVGTVVNALAFGSVHLLHHGINWSGNGLRIMPVSGMIWFVLMMGVSWIFTVCRRKSGSIWTAVFSHAVFNLVMNVTIFTALI